MGTDTLQRPCGARGCRSGAARDGVALALSGMALLVAIFGGFRTRTAGMRWPSPRRLASWQSSVIVVARISSGVTRPSINACGMASSVHGFRHHAVRRPVWACRAGGAGGRVPGPGTFGFRGDAALQRVRDESRLAGALGCRLVPGIARDGYSWNPAGAGPNIAFIRRFHAVAAWRAPERRHPLWATASGAGSQPVGVRVRVPPRRSALGRRAWTRAVGLLAAYPFAVSTARCYTSRSFLLCSAGAFYISDAASSSAPRRSAPLRFTRPKRVPARGAAGAGLDLARDARRRGATKRGRTSARIAASSASHCRPSRWLRRGRRPDRVLRVHLHADGRPFAWLEAHAAWGGRSHVADKGAVPGHA